MVVTMSWNYNTENGKGGLWCPLHIYKVISQKAPVFPGGWAEYHPLWAPSSYSSSQLIRIGLQEKVLGPCSSTF